MAPGKLTKNHLKTFFPNVAHLADLFEQNQSAIGYSELLSLYGPTVVPPMVKIFFLKFCFLGFF